MVVQIYVDYVIFGSTNPKCSRNLANLIKNHFKMSIVGEISSFLGLQVH